MKNNFLIIFLVFLICDLFSSGSPAQESSINGETSDDSETGIIEITSTISKIRWDGDIIRSWDASDGVEIEYSRGGRIFKCTSDKALFTREGDIGAFRDKITLGGNVSGDLSGIKVETSELILENIGSSYRVESGKDTKVTGDNYVFITDSLSFNASDGLGEFPDGAQLDFRIETAGMVHDESASESTERNFFGQCLRIDARDGSISAPKATVEYEMDNNNDFRLCRIIIPSGAEIGSVYRLAENQDIVLKFGNGEFDFENMKFKVGGSVSIVNGPCEVVCGDLLIDWNARKMRMSGGVNLERESVNFTTDSIDLDWDDEGRLSLVAQGKPKMTITVPQEQTEELLKGS